MAELGAGGVEPDPFQWRPVPGLQARLALTAAVPARQQIIRDHVAGPGECLDVLTTVGGYEAGPRKALYGGCDQDRRRASAIARSRG
jgi:hypothetical protein